MAFLVSELVGELLTAGVGPTAQQLPVIAALAPDRVAASVRRRLAGLPADAQALARAVAILGAETELPVAAALAGLDESAAAHGSPLGARPVAASPSICLPRAAAAGTQPRSATCVRRRARRAHRVRRSRR